MKIPKISARPPIPDTEPPVVKTRIGGESERVRTPARREGEGLKRMSVLGKRNEREGEKREVERKKTKGRGRDSDDETEAITIDQMDAQDECIILLLLLSSLSVYFYTLIRYSQSFPQKTICFLCSY